MAILTKILGRFAEGQVVFEVDYDTAKNYLTALRCINNSQQAAWGMATQVANGRSYSMRFPPGNTHIAIPGAASQRLAIVILPNGKLDGVDYRLMWPYP